MFCRDLHLALMFSGLQQKDLFKGKWSVLKKFFKTKLLSRLSQKVRRLPSSPVLLRKFTNKSDLDIKKQNNSARALLFLILFISLPLLYDYDLKMPDLILYGGLERRRNFLFLVNLDIVLMNSVSEEFAYIQQSKWVWIIAVWRLKERDSAFGATFSPPVLRY